MLKHGVSLVVALYAIGFAFLALASVRWPSLLTLASLFGENAGAIGEIEGLLNWRELGLTHGLAYLVTALCFYFSSTLIGRGKRSAVFFYVVAIGTGFLPLMLLDFEPGWWRGPDQFQQIIMLAAITAIFIISLVWEASGVKKATPEAKDKPDLGDQVVLSQALVRVDVSEKMQPEKVKKIKRRYPVPPAIARQRASFAAHGRRTRARRVR